jgi:hypothetical protein
VYVCVNSGAPDSERSPPDLLEAQPPIGQAGPKPFQIVVLGDQKTKTISPRQRFADLIPARPYCADHVHDGLKIRCREVALRHRLLQLNSPQVYTWLPFDVDWAGAYYAARDANLPPPTFIAANPGNGHAHLAWLLRKPVQNFASSHSSPLHYMAAVQRGLRRRLEADPHYSGLISKNPQHLDWRVEWQAPDPYDLDDLADWLFPHDMRPEPVVAERLGLSRNCTVFEDVRPVAYREVLCFKRNGASLDQWQQHCIELAAGSNRQFHKPLGYSEIRAIGKSIAKWTWRRFSAEKFAERQSRRASRTRKRTKQRMFMVEALRHASP